MYYSLHFPTKLKASPKLPTSKSISNRVLMLHYLSEGTYAQYPREMSVCDDSVVMMRSMPAPPGTTLNLMAAGSAMRFLTAYFSIKSGGTYTLVGTERLCERPIGILVDALRQLGADITYLGDEGFPPLRITGKELEGGEITIPANISSQFASALLMIAPKMKNGLHLHLTEDIVSQPYIEITTRLMEQYGAAIKKPSQREIIVKPGPYRGKEYRVEPDWASASYWYEIALLAEKDYKYTVKLHHMSYPGMQADTDGRTLNFGAHLGLHTYFTADGWSSLEKYNAPRIEVFERNFLGCPDLAQTFVVTCCLMNQHFRFTGLQTLAIKETDRGKALVTELAKLGYAVQQPNNSELVWMGERIPVSSEEPPLIQTYNDHRMAMAFAPAAIRFPGLRIEDPEVVSKSYPNFWDDLRAAGVRIEESA